MKSIIFSENTSDENETRINTPTSNEIPSSSTEPPPQESAQKSEAQGM